MTLLYHTTWVGPPPDNTKINNVTGHDVMAIMDFEKHASSKITICFWCQEKYLPHYQKTFANTRITVSAIEKVVKAEQDDPRFFSYAERILALMERLSNDSRNHVRDRVTIKNVFSLFLLLFKGGFVADSNIFANAETSKKLIDFDNKKKSSEHIFIPKVAEETIYKRISIEVWLMYVGRPLLSRAFDMMDYFLCKQGKAEAIFDRERYSDEYHSMCGNTITHTALLSTPTRDMEQRELSFWKTSVKEGNAFMDIDELDLTKYYYNTHKKRASYRGFFSQSFAFIALRKTSFIEYMLAHGHNVDEEIHFKTIKNLRLVTHALLLDEKEIVATILQHHPDLESKVTINGRQKTLFDLAEEKHNRFYINFIRHTLLTLHAETLPNSFKHVKSGDLNTLEAMIHANSDVVNESIDINGLKGYTLLMYAIDCKQDKIIAMLATTPNIDYFVRARYLNRPVSAFNIACYQGEKYMALLNPASPRTSFWRPEPPAAINADDSKALKKRLAEEKKIPVPGKTPAVSS